MKYDKAVCVLLSVFILACSPLEVPVQRLTWDEHMLAGDKAYQQGRYDDAERQFSAALKVAVEFGQHPPSFASSSLNSLALVYSAQGRYAQAEAFYQLALENREQQHLDEASSLNNLALLYENKGLYAEAEPLYQRALAIRERALGPQHPEVATSLNNLAVFYHSQGRYAEAEPLYQRALAIFKKAMSELVVGLHRVPNRI